MQPKDRALLGEKKSQAWYSTKKRAPHICEDYTSGRRHSAHGKKMERGPFQGQGTTKWGPSLAGRGRNLGGKGPPALGSGPALYLASIVQGGRTQGGGGLRVKGREQVLPSQLSPFSHPQP